MLDAMPGELLDQWMQYRRIQNPEARANLSIDLTDDPAELTRLMRARVSARLGDAS